jgi:hypothetical protein
MTWNYRVMRFPDGHLAVHEVYYDDRGRPVGYTEHPVSFAVDAAEGFQALIESMKQALGDALERPILDAATVDPSLPEPSPAAGHDPASS